MPKPHGRSTKQPGRRHLHAVPAPGARTDAPPTAPLIDAAVQNLRESLQDAPKRMRELGAEAAAAHIVTMIDDMATQDDGGQDRQMLAFFWRDAARELRRRHDELSWILLTAWARIVDKAFRLPLQRARAERFSHEPPRPAWVDGVGTARLVRAVRTEDFTGDGVNIVLGFDDGYGGHTLITFIDNNLGGIAKDVFVGPPMDEAIRMYAGTPGIVVRDVKIAAALGSIVVAVNETVTTPDPPVSDDFEYLNSLLLSRIGQAAIRPELPPEPVAAPPRERSALIRDFLASEYALALGLDERLISDVAGTWVDHAVDCTVGGPLRVSAVLVELFLAYWVPHAVEEDAEYLAAIPPVVRAWLRFAAEQTDLPDEPLVEALGSVERFAPMMLPGTVEHLGPGPVLDVTGLGSVAATYLTCVGQGAWVLAGETLGSEYADVALGLTERLVREAPSTFDGARITTWPAAIAWYIAEERDLVGRGGPLPVGRLAEELGSTPQTLRAKAKLIRAAIG